MRIKLLEMLNEDGLDVNDYRGAIGVLDLPEAEAKHLIDAGRAVLVVEKKKKAKIKSK